MNNTLLYSYLLNVSIEDPDIQLTVDCSHIRALVTWSTPYPISRLFMMYSCSDVLVGVLVIQVYFIL